MSDVTLDSAAAAFCDVEGDSVLDLEVDGTDSFNCYVDPGSYMLKVTVLNEATGTVTLSAEAMEINRKYRARICHAADIRKARYEHPEQIDKAARTVCVIMGGVNNDILTGMSETEADNARLSIENAERERLQREEWELQLEARAGEVMN